MNKKKHLRIRKKEIQNTNSIEDIDNEIRKLKKVRKLKKELRLPMKPWFKWAYRGKTNYLKSFLI